MKGGLCGKPVPLPNGTGTPCKASTGSAVLSGVGFDMCLARPNIVAIHEGINRAGGDAGLCAAVAGFADSGGSGHSGAPQCPSERYEKSRFCMHQEPDG